LTRVQRQQQIGKILQVFVRDNNVDQALRVLKKKLQREGVFREMKRRRAYEKPSERKTREKAEAVSRRLGMGIRPSRWASFLAAFRVRSSVGFSNLDFYFTARSAE